MSQMAQEVQRAVDEIKKSEPKPKARKLAAVAKPKTPRGKKAAKASDAGKARVVTAGLRKNPKGKGLKLNTIAARAVTEKALKAILPDLDGDERFEAERLLARLAARE